MYVSSDAPNGTVPPNLSNYEGILDIPWPFKEPGTTRAKFD